MISIALIFVLVVTGAYKRSITTTVYVVSLVISFQCVKYISVTAAGAVLVAGAIIALVRAVINHEDDRLFKRGYVGDDVATH